MTDAELEALARTATGALEAIEDELHAREATLPNNGCDPYGVTPAEALRHARRKFSEARLQITGGLGWVPKQ